MKCSLLDHGLYFYPEKDNLAYNKACCTFSANKLNRISLSNLSNIFQDEHRISAINALKNNEDFVSCNSCWKHEKVGYSSMRTRVNDLGIKGKHGQLKYLELNTGNTCNIQCVMCNPNDSMKTKMYIPIREKYKQFDSSRWENLYARGLRKSDIDALDFSVFKNLEYLKSTGGETFYSKEYWYMLEKFIDKGYAQNITIINVTNNTIPLDKTKLEIFKNFKRVKIFSSVDGIGELCESIRAGSVWNDVNDNIQHLIELHKEYPKIFSHTEPHTVVQYANALQLDEIVNWWEKISHPAFRTKQYFRILDQPSYYDIRNLNQKIKDKIQDRYRNIKKLKHVVNYLKTNNSLHDSEMGYNIFSESCLINKVNPLSSHVHKEMEDAIQ